MTEKLGSEALRCCAVSRNRLSEILKRLPVVHIDESMGVIYPSDSPMNAYFGMFAPDEMDRAQRAYRDGQSRCEPRLEWNWDLFRIFTRHENASGAIH